MTTNSNGGEEVACSLLWKLVRTHGWSAEVTISDLASDANVTDEKRAREVARTTLPDKKFVGYHSGKDTIWLDPPPTDDLAHHLRDSCGYTELQIEATLDSYFDGF